MEAYKLLVQLTRQHHRNVLITCHGILFKKHIHTIISHEMMGGHVILKCYQQQQNMYRFGTTPLFSANLSIITESKLDQWRQDFYCQPKNVLAQNACTHYDPYEVALSRQKQQNISHVFTYKVDSEVKPLTNQKSSGRCWLFAALNCIRIPFMKKYNIEEFEFSQSYLFYWDKIERANYFLNNIVKVLQRGEQVDGRLMSFLLMDPTNDGGQWDMLVNLIVKYGIMPKKNFPESFSTESSAHMNAILQTKLREYAKALTDMMKQNPSDDDINKKITQLMFEVYKIVGICLGIPDKEFTWEYYDKNKAYHKVGPITPLDFYNTIVKPYFNVEDKVCLVTDPRPTNSYNAAYTIDCLGNVVDGRSVFYNNQPVDLLLDMVLASIKAGEPVWFGCEVNKRFAPKLGIEDLYIHDYKLVFDTEVQHSITKADRLMYGDSCMTHAMVFTAVGVDDNGRVNKLRVENSWGDDKGDKGYLIMSADWFKEFGFEVVVDKKYVPDDVMQVFNMTPCVLPAWDPMGTLAK